MRVLITGSNGLLGQKLVASCLEQNIDFWGISAGENRNPTCPAEKYSAIDITDFSAVQHFIETQHFTHIIHTAAMTNVDACEIIRKGVMKSTMHQQHLYLILPGNNIYISLYCQRILFLMAQRGIIPKQTYLTH